MVSNYPEPHISDWLNFQRIDGWVTGDEYRLDVSSAMCAIGDTLGMYVGGRIQEPSKHTNVKIVNITLF